ncbi:hypothetical protein [Paenibacillus chitinolyticus]|uniref:hypothetical protein n=1 Tax=Paenibacillus chitinolyticus TaxID=79263 RepID=UPI003D05C4D4
MYSLQLTLITATEWLPDSNQFVQRIPSRDAPRSCCRNGSGAASSPISLSLTLRGGCEQSLLQAILQARPARLVYVSCNPAILAKDCETLLRGGYQIEWVQPVNMFPQMTHVECRVSLERKDTVQ